MEEKSLYKTATEFDLALKLANIADDAILEKTGVSGGVLALNEILGDSERNKKFVSAASNPIDALIKLVEKGVKGGASAGGYAVKGLGLASLLYLLYSGGNRIGNWANRAILGKDPRGEGNKADPYEHIDRTGIYPSYKFQQTNEADQSNVVSPGFYVRDQKQEPWYEDAERNSMQDAIRRSGVPANFGIADGFGVGGGDAYSNAVKLIPRSSDKIEFTKEAQSFVSKSVEGIPGGGRMNEDIKDWVNVKDWESFLAQSVGGGPMGGYAAMPDPSAAFYDPSGTLGRDKPMEWKPVGYGQDNYQQTLPDKLNFMKQRLEAFNEPETYREATKAIWRMKQIDLLEQNGIVNANQAAEARVLITKGLQGLNPEGLEEIDNLIERAGLGGFQTMPGQEEIIGLPENQINWEDRTDPMSNPIYQQMVEQGQTAMDDYKNTPIYDTARRVSPTLSRS